MKTTSLFTKLGLALALTAGMAATTLAGPPYDAGYKARGMKERNQGVTQRYVAPTWAAPQVAGRQAFSYVPQTAPAVQSVPCQATVQPQAAAPVRTEVRRFSYTPAAPVPAYRGGTYRGGRTHSGYGGDYQSKATLKY